MNKNKIIITVLLAALNLNAYGMKDHKRKRVDPSSSQAKTSKILNEDRPKTREKKTISYYPKTTKVNPQTLLHIIVNPPLDVNITHTLIPPMYQTPSPTIGQFSTRVNSNNTLSTPQPMDPRFFYLNEEDPQTPLLDDYDPFFGTLNSPLKPKKPTSKATNNQTTVTKKKKVKDKPWQSFDKFDEKAYLMLKALDNKPKKSSIDQDISKTQKEIVEPKIITQQPDVSQPKISNTTNALLKLPSQFEKEGFVNPFKK